MGKRGSKEGGAGSDKGRWEARRKRILKNKETLAVEKDHEAKGDAPGGGGEVPGAGGR